MKIVLADDGRRLDVVANVMLWIEDISRKEGLILDLYTFFLSILCLVTSLAFSSALISLEEQVLCRVEAPSVLWMPIGQRPTRADRRSGRLNLARFTALAGGTLQTLRLLTRATSA
jgi:hypothetical protein